VRCANDSNAVAFIEDTSTVLDESALGPGTILGLYFNVKVFSQLSSRLYSQWDHMVDNLAKACVCLVKACCEPPPLRFIVEEHIAKGPEFHATLHARVDELIHILVQYIERNARCQPPPLVTVGSGLGLAFASRVFAQGRYIRSPMCKHFRCTQLFLDISMY
jgi:hypothetical protein